MVRRMTGPGPGKILLNAKVYLEPPHYELRQVEVYLHVRGYSRARVTHLDIEHPSLNVIIPPREGYFLRVYALNGGIRVKLKQVSKYASSYVSEILILCEEINRVISPGERTIAWVGGKEGGIYLGFKKKYVDKLERLAEDMGIEIFRK